MIRLFEEQNPILQGGLNKKYSIQEVHKRETK